MTTAALVIIAAFAGHHIGFWPGWNRGVSFVLGFKSVREGLRLFAGNGEAA
jgi:hypothetical protein